MAGISAERFPTLSAYVAALPDGLDSYPSCQARSSLCIQFIEAMSFPRLKASELPAPLSRVLLAPAATSWIPEVHVMGLCHAIADHYRFDEGDFLSWVYGMNRTYFGSLIFRALMAFLTPKALAQRAGDRWGHIHKGSSLLSTVTGPNSAELDLRYPKGLFSPLLLKSFSMVWKAALEHSHAAGSSVTIADLQPERTVYEVKWS